MKTAKTKEQPAVTPEKQEAPPKTYHHWWFIGIFAAMIIIAGLVYLIAGNGDKSIFPRGPNDPLPVNIENYYDLSKESRVYLLDQLEQDIANNPKDKELRQKLLNSYLNAEQYDNAYNELQAYEQLLTDEEKDLTYNIMAGDIAVWAGKKQEALNYLNKARDTAPSNTDGMREWEINRLENLIDGMP